ncbi:MAG: Gfo/Idh/MocA family oxidoreductase [Oscillospiraceae bacterium]|nr:Gfo/Idh/MocA family oxidoreductase [Oscillospiraceae bacterium]
MGLKPVKVALVGAGNISYTYLNTLSKGFNIIDLVGCSDLVEEKSKARAELFGIRQMTTQEILDDPEIEIVLNTTEIWNHVKVSKMILESGKSVYSEKSAGGAYDETFELAELAKSKGLLFGCAPDIYMGAAYQTARKLIDDGWIGEPIGVQAWCFRGYGMNAIASTELRYPLGSKGSTITYDMGGYYINAIVSLLGPVKRAAGFASVFGGHTFDNVTNPQYGQKIDIGGGASVMMASLEFESGVYGSLFLTADGFGPEIPRVEIWGTKGTLSVPDPNCFGGYGLDVVLTRIGNKGPFVMPFSHAFGDTDPSIPAKSGKNEPCRNSWRGIAVVDMAYALRRGRPPRSGSELALHTVEIVSAIEENSQENPGVYTIKSRPPRPEPLRPGMFGPIAVMEAAIDNC